MASIPFRAVNWAPNELIGEDKMDQMSSNMNWLRDNTPRAVYTTSSPQSIRKVEGIRIASGKALIPARKSDLATVSVRFGNFFSANCHPNITTGIINNYQPKVFCTISGFGDIHPDHRGFNITVNVDAFYEANDSIKRSFYVSWQAMGY